MNDKIEISRSDLKRLIKMSEGFRVDSETLNRCRALLNTEWVPQEGEECYVVNGDGEIEDIHYCSKNYLRNYLKQGHIFKTREQAEWFVEYEQRQAKKLRVLRELILFAKEYNGDWDWDNPKQSKYFLFYRYEVELIQGGPFSYVKYNNLPTFKDNAAKALREKFGDRLNVLFEAD